MNKKLLTGIIIGVGIALTIFAPMIIGVLAIPTWIYLVSMVRKRKTGIFSDKMEPRLAERRLKRLKEFLIVSGIACLVSIASIILHNVPFGLPEIVESVSFFVALGALWVFVLATAGGLMIFLRGRQKISWQEY